MILLLFLLAAWRLGSFALRPFREALDPWEWAGFSVGLGFGILSYGTFALGLCGLLAPWNLWVWVGLPALFSIKQIFSLNLPPKALSIDGWTLYEKTSCLILTACLVLFALAAGAPPVTMDALSYHLALPKLYLKHGSITFIPYINASDWPALMEMLYLLALAMGKVQAAQQTHWFMGFLVILWIYRVGNLFSYRWVGLTAANLFSTMVLFKTLAITAFVDLGFCFYSLMALYALWRYRERRKPLWLFLIGIMAGLSGAVKLTGFIWVGVLFFMLFATRHREEKNAPSRTLLRECLLVGLCFLAVMFPWLARSFRDTGNPIWPFFHSWLGGPHWDAAQTQLWFGYAFENLAGATWAESLTQKLFGMFVITGRSFYLPGLFFSAFGIFSILYRERLFPPAIRSSFYAIGIYGLIYLLFIPESMRYLIPILPLMALGTAEGLHAVSKRRALGRWVSYSLVALLMTFRFPAMDKALWHRAATALGLWSEETYLHRSLDIYPISMWINQHLGSEDKVLLLNDLRSFYINRDYVWGDPHNQKYIRYDGLERVEDLLGRLRERGITHVLVKSGQFTWAAEGGAVVQAFLNSTPPAVRQGNCSLIEVPNHKP